MDPYFDVAISDVRGFDLGDDAELLTELHGRRVTEPESLSAEDWMLLGVLSHRALADDEALKCFERAARDGYPLAVVRYLQAQLRLAQRRIDEAETFLKLAVEANTVDAPVEANTDDPPVDERHQSGEDSGHTHIPQADLMHAHGSIARGRGQLEQAIEHYHDALMLDPTDARRWVDAAQTLVELKRFPEAMVAAKRARVEDPNLATAAYLQALAAAQAGDTDTSLEALRNAVDSDSSSAERARKEPLFGPVASEAGFTKLVRPLHHTDLDWLDAFPTWLQRVRADPKPRGLGVRWLGDEESLQQTEALVSTYNEDGPQGTLHSEATLALSLDLFSGRRVVAQGPSTITREGRAEPSWLLVDIHEPNGLLLALSDAYPPFLWLEAGETTESLCRTLGEFFPRPNRERVTMENAARGFMGYRLQFGVPSPYTGGIEPANALELDHHFTLNPFLETASWGSDYADDPWPDEIPDQPDYEVKLSERQRKVAEQATGAVWSVSRRTRHSRSYVSIELHHRDVFVIEVRYAPSSHGAPVERMNAHFGSDYPTDLPVDVVGALLGFRFDSASDLQTQLEATAAPDKIAGCLTVLSALRHSDMGATRIYRRYMDHPDPVVRATLCNIFAAYNFESLLEEMSLSEPDPEVAQQLESLLDSGIPVTEYDPYADYATSDSPETGEDGELT